MTFQAREAVTVTQKAPKEDEAKVAPPSPEPSPETAPEGVKGKKFKEV
jgi:hypothetical protein